MHRRVFLAGVLHYFKQDYFHLPYYRTSLLILLFVYKFLCYYYRVYFILNIKLYMFIVENIEIQKSMIKKTTLINKIKIIHNSTSGSILVCFLSIIYQCSYIDYVCVETNQNHFAYRSNAT